VIAAARDAVRWRWYRARYVAQTEGVGTLARRSAGMVGLLPKAVIPERVLSRPAPTPITEESAATWPLAVLLLGPPAGTGPGHHHSAARLRQCAEQGVPAVVVHAGEPWRSPAQLASVLLVQPQWWGEALPSIRHEAARLRQRVVADLNSTDSPPPGVDLVLIARDPGKAGAGQQAEGGRPPMRSVPLDAPGEVLAAALSGGAS
jgi:hypothetical protein